METNLFKNIPIGKIIVTIGIGIISTLINNFCGVNAGTSGIIGLAMMYATGIFLWAYEWIKTVNDTLSKIDTSQQINSSNNTSTTTNVISIQADPKSMMDTVQNIINNTPEGDKEEKGGTK